MELLSGAPGSTPSSSANRRARSNASSALLALTGTGPASTGPTEPPGRDTGPPVTPARPPPRRGGQRPGPPPAAARGHPVATLPGVGSRPGRRVREPGPQAAHRGTARAPHADPSPPSGSPAERALRAWLEQGPEALQVELAGLHAQPVPGRLRHQPGASSIVLEAAAKARDVGVQGGARAGRWRRSPQPVDELVTGDDPVAAEQQHCQGRPLLRPAERENAALVEDLERAEYPELQAAPFRRPPSNPSAHAAVEV